MAQEECRDNMVKFNHVIHDIYRLETPAGGVWSGIILVDGVKKILIDSGENAGNIDEILIPALADLGYQITDIDYLCNTHCHGDHVGGHKRIVELGHPKVVAYEKSVPKIRDPLKYSKLIRATFPEHSPAAPTVLEGVEPNLVMEDGDLLADRLMLIATPGHDDDTICYYDTMSKTLISGDSLQGNGTLTQGTALYMDVDDYRSSLQRVQSIDIENIISAHPYGISGDIAIGYTDVKEYMSRCYQVTVMYEDYIRKQIAQGETNPVNIAKGLIQFMGNQEPAKLFLPLYTVTAHIRKFGAKSSYADDI